MARIRKFVAYRSIERPYTRKSKYKKKNYVRSCPASKLVRCNMGNINKKFEFTLNLVSKAHLQIRHNSLESARLTANKMFEENAGKDGYFMRLRVYPHHILRENALASGAGADRLSTGMQAAFGKNISVAAQIRKGQTVIEARVNKQHLEMAKKALHRAAYKMPCSFMIAVEKNLAV